MKLYRENAHTVDYASYNPVNKMLRVNFIKGGSYYYHDVQREDAEQLMNAGDNFMKVFSKVIRPNYICTK